MSLDIQIKKGFVETYPLWEATIGKLWSIDAETYAEVLHDKIHLSAFNNGTLVGILIYDFDLSQKIGSINLIIIEPDFQRLGVGSRLITEAKAELKLVGIKEVVLASCNKGGLWRALPKNIPCADIFFSRLGWDLTAESLDQAGSIENYRSPEFLNVRPRRQDIIFRFFDIKDKQKLLAFQQQQFPHWQTYFAQFIAAKAFENILVVESNNDIIGACLLEYPGQKFMGSNWVKMLGADCGSPSVLGVAENYRGYGIGYYLFDHAMTILAQRGAQHAFINFSDAPHVYKRFGFEVIWEHKQGVCVL